MADSPYSFISETNSHTPDFSIPRCARRQLGLPVSVNISGIKICTSALHKQIDRSLCLIYIDPTVLHRNVHKSEAELLYFIRRIIRHLRNGLPFGILKCTTAAAKSRRPFFIRLVTVAENYLVLRSPVKLVEADTEAADTNDKIIMLFGSSERHEAPQHSQL